MNKIYVLTNPEDPNSLLEANFIKIPGTAVFARIVEQDIDSELPQSDLKYRYNNPVWKKRFYNKNKEMFKKNLGLEYRGGKALLNEKFKTSLCSWMLQVDFNDDPWLGFTSYDPCDQNIYYGKNFVDKYCKDEIKELLDKNIIKVIEVE